MSPVNNYVKDIAAGFFNKGLHLNQALCPRFYYERLEHHQFLHITFCHTVLTLHLPAVTLLFASHKILHVVEAPKPVTLTLPLFFSMYFLNFQWKTKKMFGFCWNCLKSDWLKRLGTFEWFLISLISFNPFSTGKILKLDFWDPNNSTNFKHQ